MKVNVSSPAFQSGYRTAATIADHYIATKVLLTEPYNPYAVESDQFQWDAGYKAAFAQRQIFSRKVIEIGALCNWTPPQVPPIDVHICGC